MRESRIGRVVHFFARPGVGAVRVEEGVLRLGDVVRVSGRVTDLYQRIDSLQIDGAPADTVQAGETAGIRFDARVRENDQVFRLEEQLR